MLNKRFYMKGVVSLLQLLLEGDWGQAWAW